VRELVLAGLSNAEVLVELAHRFPRLHLEPGGRHRSYAGWYRRYWARRGVVAPGTAPARKPKRRKAPAR
jgi:hypothetical protein